MVGHGMKHVRDGLGVRCQLPQMQRHDNEDEILLPPSTVKATHHSGGVRFPDNRRMAQWFFQLCSLSAQGRPAGLSHRLLGLQVGDTAASCLNGLCTEAHDCLSEPIVGL